MIDATNAPRVPLYVLIGVILLLVVGLTVAIVLINQGHFIYTLDDPYIHLSVSEQIRHGGYGVNAGEFSSPSSSIIFPFIFAPFAGTSIQQYLPFALNVACLFVTITLGYRFLLLVGFDASIKVAAAAAILIGIYVVFFNVVGLVFNGMEHSGHIALTVAIIYGLAVFLKSARLPPWLPGAIVVAPLFRYEALSLSLASVLLLAYYGRKFAACAVAACIVVLLGSFSMFLLALGLPPFPSSILIKSGLVASGTAATAVESLFHVIKDNVQIMFKEPAGLVLLLACIPALLAIVFCVWRDLADKARAAIAVVLIIVVGAHAIAGRFGWFGRYEIYALTAVVLLLAFLAEPYVRRTVITPLGLARFFLGTAVAMLMIGFPYAKITAMVPLAANNVYEQQYQMHRFLTEVHRAPVAVNDLGWTSYENNNYVLDLYGLGSETARLARLSGDSKALYRLVREHGVKVIIIYPSWFPGQVPDEWVRVGSMQLSRKRITPAVDTVVFFASDAIYVDELKLEMQTFSRILPPRVKLELY